MPLESGSAIGSYTVIAKLGEGGMGEVYRARDTRLGRDVALKVLPPEVTKEAGRLERFDREARAIAALNHPHIVTIYSTEEADGVRFLTMELVEGKTLSEVIVPGGLPVARFLEIALQIADALTAAHQKQITHRDLKPGNVMVTHDDRVKVLDFGLARVGETEVAELSLAATHAPITHQGMLVGTMPYMSPEQVEGQTPDPRSDLFSLGVIFYEMLSGERPFKGSSSPALMSAILRDTPPGICEVRTDVPEALGRLISRCIEKRREDRVQTARDVFNELRHLQKQLGRGSGASSSSTRRAAPVVADNLWVAVLPFQARSNDDDSRTLADALTEDITTALSRFGYLRVLSRAAAERLAAVASSPSTPAAQPHPRFALEGTVRKAGGTLRVGVRIIDTQSGANLWAENFDREAAAGTFSLQDELTARIAATIGDNTGVLSKALAVTLIDAPLEQLAIEELGIRYHAYGEHMRREEHARLREALERFVEREPSSAAAWALLSRLYEHEHSQGLNPLADAMGRQRRSAERAVEIDPRHQQAWTSLASARFFSRDLPGMRASIERALAINPLNADHVAFCALLLSAAGDDDQALTLVRRAMTNKPQHPGWYHFITFAGHYRRGAWEDALTEGKRINMPMLPSSHYAVAAAAGQLRRAVDARLAIDALRAISPALVDPSRARQTWAVWSWDERLVQPFVEGFEAALAIAGGREEQK